MRYDNLERNSGNHEEPKPNAEWYSCVGIEFLTLMLTGYF